MPARFEETEKQFIALKARREAGQLTDADYEGALRALVVQDEAGTYWMLGTESGRWYRYDGQEWVGADPPIEAAEPSQKNINVAVAAAHLAKRLQPRAWIALGSAGVVTITVCALVLVLLSATSPRREVPLAPTAAAGSTYPPFPAAAAGLTESNLCDTVQCYQVPASGLVTLSDPGLILSVPAGWTYAQATDHLEVRPSESDRTVQLAIYWYTVPFGSSAEKELRNRLGQLPNTTLSAISFDRAAMGDLAWCTGAVGETPYYGAVAGPDAENRVLFVFWLQHVTGAQLPLMLLNETAQQSQYSK